MKYTFDIEVAGKYNDPNIAVFIEYLYFWLDKNRKNGRNYYDGQYWTYNTVATFRKVFPWLSESQIKRLIKKMKELEIIRTGEYNSSKYNKTKWYTFTDEFCKDNADILRYRL